MNTFNLNSNFIHAPTVKKIFNKANVVIFIIAVIHTALTALTDKNIFSFETFDFFVPLPCDGTAVKYYYVATKAIALICYYLFYQIAFRVYLSFKNKNKNVILNFFVPFVILLGFYIVNWNICYPGVYNIDDGTMYAFATKYYAFYWHNYLTSLFHMVGLTMFPFASGQLILLDIFTALVFSYLFYRLSQVLADKKAKYLRFILLVFAVSPFINTITLNSFRPYLYSILNLFFFGYLLFEKIQKRELTLAKLLGLALGLAVLAFWRSESIVYLIFAPFLICVTYSHAIKWKKALLFTVASILLFGAVNIPQQIGNNKYYNNDYFIVSTTRPLSVLLNLDETYSYQGSAEDIQKIDKIINVEHIKSLPLESISYQSWNTYYHQGMISQTLSSKQDQAEYLKAFARIVSHNFNAFLKERADLFIKTNNLQNILQIDFGRELVKTIEPSLAPYWIFNQTIQDQHYFPGQMSNSEYWSYITFQRENLNMIYSIIPYLLLAIVLIVLCLIMKAWLVFLIQLLIWVRELIVFITSPSNTISYYMPSITLSMLVLVLLVIFGLYNKQTGKSCRFFV